MRNDVFIASELPCLTKEEKETANRVLCRTRWLQTTLYCQKCFNYRRCVGACHKDNRVAIFCDKFSDLRCFIGNMNGDEND